MNLELTITILVVVTILLAFIGLYRWLKTIHKSDERFSESFDEQKERRKSFTNSVDERLSGTSLASSIERQLIAADSKLTVTEYLLLRVGVGLAFLLAGWFISGYALGGILLALIGAALPAIQLKRQQNQRLRLFAEQLPDFLNLVIGSLRAGYGLLQALTVVQDEMPEPMSTEFSRVIKETALGFSVGEALDHLVQRIDNEDLELIVTSIHIQTEVGGNLAEVMDTISHTIRDRIQLNGEIRVMTTQQRTTAAILSALPFIVGTLLMLINPTYMMRMFEPGLTLIIPIGAFLLIIVGNLVMNRLMKIAI